MSQLYDQELQFNMDETPVYVDQLEKQTMLKVGSKSSRLVTYRFINSLVITKILKIRNYKNVFQGQLSDTIRGHIDDNS